MAQVATLETAERELSDMSAETEPGNGLEHTPHRLVIERRQRHDG